MKKLNRWILGTSFLPLLLLLSGCVDINKKTGAPTGEGWVYKLLVVPVGKGITFFADLFDGNYGLAIILITIIVRFIILPLNLHQSRKTMIQTEKTAVLKPQIDALQANIKAATSQDEQMRAQQEFSAFYKENGLSMTGGIGCLPLLIQMPIFTALFYAVKYTDGINASNFFGINLGERSIILVVLAGIAYLGQGFISMIGIPDEQKKMMRSTLIISPLMIVFMSFNAPAGVTLYWVIGGIFGCAQTMISNLYHKPRIKSMIAADFKKNPPRKVVTPEIKKAKPVNTTTKKNRNANPQGRNAGKQQQRNK